MALRILHAVELYAPSVGGAQEVVRQVSERLARRGHDVTVATTALAERAEKAIAGVTVAGFEVSGNGARGLSGDVEGYRSLVREGGFDVVMTYAAQQWTTDALLGTLDDIPGATVLAPCGFSGLADPAYAAYFGRLAALLDGFDELIFHSAGYQDIEFCRAAGAERMTVIANGADEGEFAGELDGMPFRRRCGIAADEPLLLTVGGHTGLKGHALAMDALRASSEMAGGALAIVGNRPTGRGCLATCRARAQATRLLGRGRHVVLADPPRGEVVSAYAAADLFVLCSMVECSPLVLFEAMAAGLPFVSVDVGNAAEIAEWSGAGVIVPSSRRRDGLVEADAKDVARAVDELMADDQRRAEMGERGRRAWRDRFTWDALATRYEDLYLRLAA